MNIDKKLLMQLASLDDRSLESAVKMFAASSGLTLDEKLDKAKLDALRNKVTSLFKKNAE